MSAIKKVTSTSDAEALAGLLNGRTRTRPTVVVTIASGQAGPYADLDEIAGQLGDLADVYLVTNGRHTWDFSNRMKPGTQVYGGAGRVYPVGHQWLDDLEAAPLRFAWSRAEGSRLTKQLIEDALDMAAAAGLFDSASTASTRERRSGVVRSIMSERAVVDVGSGELVVIPPQLAQAGVPIDRVLEPGMVVDGVLEKKSRWFDIREHRLPAAEALRAYRIGDVVPARVRTVTSGSAGLWLHPDVTVEVGRGAVTDDPTDDLQVLLTPGEVVTARVTALGPGWQLSLRTVGDEEPRSAISLYAGGPPWLDPYAPDEAEPAEPTPEPPTPATPTPATPAPTPHLTAHVGIPTPAMMPRRKGEPMRPVPPTAPAQPDGEAVKSMSLKLTAAKAEKNKLAHELTRLRHEIEELHEEVSGLRNERVQLAKDLDRATRQLTTRESELARMRSQLRKAKQRTIAVETPVFADPERGFRHLVEAAWARRIPVGEQPARPLPHYAVGPDFLASVESLEGVSVDKIADVVMEVLTGVAEQSAGRELHALRTSSGGNASAQTRDDGATCYRVSLQVNAPSARRLHFWRRSDGTIELSRVVVHDDMEP